MTKLRKVGFYKELRYGDIDGPSINSKLDIVWLPMKQLIIEYLQKGVVYIASPGLSKDYFDSVKIIGPGPNIITDGRYAWSSDLVYYVSNYEVGIPNEFIMFMQTKNWQLMAEDVDLQRIEL